MGAAASPAGVVALLDNVPSNRSAEIHEWLKDGPDRTLRLTPTAASWTDAAVCFLSKLTKQGRKDASFDPPDERMVAGDGHIERHQPNELGPLGWSGSSKDSMEASKGGTGGCGQWHRATVSSHRLSHSAAPWLHDAMSCSASWTNRRLRSRRKPQL